VNTTLGAPSKILDLDDDLFQEAWVDGLPVVPPTKERVEKILRAIDRDPLEIVGIIPPLMGVATVEKVAINMVMAGCKPEYASVVFTALEAILKPKFNLNGVQATTHNCSPLIVVSGPIAEQLDLNSGPNVFGSGFRSNATIGRAIRLVLLHLGGAVPGKLDNSTFGHPGKYTFCIAENDDANPWTRLHQDYGFSKDDSAATVFACEAPHSVNDHINHTAKGILTTVADTMATVGNNNLHCHGDIMVVIGPEHAETIARDQWTKQDIKEFLFEKARVPMPLAKIGGMYSVENIEAFWPKWLQEAGDDVKVPPVKSPERIAVTVAGGLGRFSMVLHGWGFGGDLHCERIGNTV
jgi:hypothetical protein